MYYFHDFLYSLHEFPSSVLFKDCLFEILSSNLFSCLRQEEEEEG